MASSTALLLTDTAETTMKFRVQMFLPLASMGRTLLLVSLWELAVASSCGELY